MAIPVNKAALLSAISVTFEMLMGDLARVPEARSQDVSMDGHAAGSRMSPADLVSYLIGWNELVLKWLDQDDRGDTVAFPEIGFKWNELGQLAQKFYCDHADLPWGERLKRLARAKEQLVETISK